MDSAQAAFLALCGHCFTPDRLCRRSALPGGFSGWSGHRCRWLVCAPLSFATSRTSEASQGAIRAFLMATAATWLAASMWIQVRSVMDPTAGGLLLAVCAFYLFSRFPAPRPNAAKSALLSAVLLYTGVVCFVLLPQAHETLIAPESASVGRRAAIWAFLMSAPGILLGTSRRAVPRTPSPWAWQQASTHRFFRLGPWNPPS